jgi:hypothetical protein
MRSLLLLCLAVFFASAGRADNVPETTQPYDISEMNIVNIQHVTAVIGSRAPSNAPVNYSELSDDWRIDFRLKNLTNKTIIKIDWQIKIDSHTEKSEHREFKTKSKIKPGKYSVVSVSFICDHKLMQTDPDINVEVKRIQYEDETFWEPSTDSNKGRKSIM